MALAKPCMGLPQKVNSAPVLRLSGSTEGYPDSRGSIKIRLFPGPDRQGQAYGFSANLRQGLYSSNGAAL
jgi:hypothetical protein